MFEQLQDWASELGHLIKTGTGIYADIKGDDKKDNTTASPPPATTPTVTLSDLQFQPYYPLIIGGGVLLLIALALRK